MEIAQDDLQISPSLNVTDDSTPIVPCHNSTTSFSDFIENLNLLDKYPQKLKLIDALMIRPELLNSNANNIDIHRLPYLIMQKLMMHDNYRPLCKLMSKNNPQFDIHPTDVLLALLHCCDNILRQDLLSRLHTCKLAIPFLLPDPTDNKKMTLLLWAMRSIVCEWKCKTGMEIITKEIRIVDHKGPIVSFLRVGMAKSPKDFSKSQMLNMVIGDQHYFFHWNCPGGSFSRKFVDGLIELSDYLPAGKEGDSFTDTVLFLNLRGEARNSLMQLEFIKKISFMTFVLLLEEKIDNNLVKIMKEFSVLPGGLVIIFPDYDYAKSLQNSSGLLEIMSEENITMFDMKGKNEDEIRSSIQKFISEKISTTDPSQFLAISECATVAREIGMTVDEDNADCKEGYAIANDMIQMLNSVRATDAKTQMLPLQGPELWQKWAKHDKENFQNSTKGNAAVAYYNKSVEDGKKEIRQKQWDHVQQLSPLTKKFTTSLQACKPQVRTYVLQWLRLLLDDRSRTILPGMHAEHKRSKAELQRVKVNDTETSAVVKNLTNELKRQNRLLVEGSLGLEHLFREVGQMYEAVKCLGNQQHAVECYPKVMVEILNQGYPVELMDGDASHIPMTWVSAVLDQLKDFHKAKKLFVISVVGIQSTGKSTLLNTMFGLQFNVSAGRCTRGAFMQLLPVEKDGALSQKLLCDYVLIVDTEGLRAPELNSIESILHDNELATFVIGLADVAIINIYGEAPGDLNDILQTAVHAFIRMKNVSVNLSCHFVHQNVTALSADNKIKFGQQTFLDKLNEMTRLAAIAEHCESKYSSFTDIIKFDGATDVTYFPGLWKGDPPMAPVNPGYSDKALHLKSTLMSLVKHKMKSDPSFDNFQLLLKTLWIAVCRENYIFSFKNTQEIIAYNDLDAAFSGWSWTLRCKMLEWQNQARNTISNCPWNEVSVTSTACLKKADNVLQEMYIKLADEMKNFFDNSERSETLAQWRARYTTRLQHLKDDCKTEAKKQCEAFALYRKDQTKLNAIQKHYRKILLKQIEQLVTEAKQSNTTLTQSELERKFDEIWGKWIGEFSTEEYQSMYPSDESIEMLTCEVLQELLSKYSSILIPKLNRTPLRGRQDLSITISPSKHLRFTPTDVERTANVSSVNLTSAVKKFATFLHLGKDKSEEDNGVKQALKASDEILDTARNAFHKVRRNFHNFDKSYAYELLKELIDNIESYSKKHDNFFTPEYVVDMALIFASYLVMEFIKLMRQVRATGDPVESFKGLRETYLSTFLDQYRDVSGDVTAAENLGRLLLAAIEVALVQILPTKIATHMKTTDASFYQKTYFKVRILKNLATARKFELFKIYLEDIRRSFEYWAKRYVREFCMANDKKNLKTLAYSVLHEIIVHIDTTVKRLHKSMPIKQWLQKFYQCLNEVLIIDCGELQDVIEVTQIKSSSEYFIATLLDQLPEVEEEVMKIIADPNSKFSCITKWNNSPHVMLCDSLVGCIARCPFCGEQCELTDPNHAECGKDHFINIHRPTCLGKHLWNKSNKLVLDLCTYSVDSEKKFRNKDTNYKWFPYKDYRKLYANWCISNESPTEAPKYWQWFISCYLKEIIKWTGADPTSIGHLNWGAVSQEMAIASLSEVYKIN